MTSTIAVPEYAHTHMRASKKSSDVDMVKMTPSDFAKLISALIVAWRTQEAVAAELGVTQSTISRIRGGAKPSGDLAERIKAMHEAIEKQAEPVHESDFISIVRVDGYISSGGDGGAVTPNVQAVPPEGLAEISIDFPVPPGAHAFLVEGNGYYPRCQPGDAVICADYAQTFEDPIGWEAVVVLPDGSRFIRTVRRGTRAGRYTLESHVGPPMYDVQIKKACRVSMIVPAGGWRILERAAKRRIKPR